MSLSCEWLATQHVKRATPTWDTKGLKQAPEVPTGRTLRGHYSENLQTYGKRGELEGKWEVFFEILVGKWCEMAGTLEKWGGLGGGMGANG